MLNFASKAALAFALLTAVVEAVPPGRLEESKIERGIIEGCITYRGRVPPPIMVMEGGGAQDILHVNPRNGGLAFAVVSLDAAPEPPPERLPVAGMDQFGWMFRPPVLAVREGQPVVFNNADGANHNVRSKDSEPANRFSGYPTPIEPYVRAFRHKPDGAPIALSCDTHSWMIAWIYVFDHPYFAVTDNEGVFRIADVPAGLHRLQVRHPGGGLRRNQLVEATPGVTTRTDLQFEDLELDLKASPAAH